MRTTLLATVFLLAALPVQAAELTGTFEISYAPAGQFGGTETRNLVAHDGKLYAANGYWMERSGVAAPGPQVLVLDGPGRPWRIDHEFADRMPNGRPRHIAISAFNEVTFRTDARGMTLKAPVSMLLASTWDVTGLRTIFARDDRTGAWSGTAIGRDPPRPRWLPQIRSFGFHHDQRTGADMAFAGDSAGILAGVFDPSAAGQIRWNISPELDTRGLNADAFPGLARRLRISSFAESGGRLFAAVGQQVWVRDDGAAPRWRLLYTNPEPHFSEMGLRGLTAVSEGGKQFLLAAVEGMRSRIVRIDPATGADATDLDLAHFLDTAWGTRVGYMCVAYNDMAQSGGDLLIGFETFIPDASPVPAGHATIQMNNRLEAGAWFVVRHPGGHYELHQVTARFPEIGGTLVSARTFVASPFPAEPGAFYVGGYDANDTKTHNTAWIARFVPR